MKGDNFIIKRLHMVQTQLIDRGIKDQKVIEAMMQIPRHLFMPANAWKHAYKDRAYSIGGNQTISQPFIVAFMTTAAKLSPDSKVLEIGTGSGYQAAILSKICKEVYTIEVIKELGVKAIELLAELGLNNVHECIGNGYDGWPEEAPFDVILATAAPPECYPLNY